MSTGSTTRIVDDFDPLHRLSEIVRHIDTGVALHRADNCEGDLAIHLRRYFTQDDSTLQVIVDYDEDVRAHSFTVTQSFIGEKHVRHTTFWEEAVALVCQWVRGGSL